MAKRSTNQIDFILQMYDDGTSVADIVEATELSYDWVLRLLKSKGVYKHPLRRNTIKSIKKDLLDLIESKDEVKQVSKPAAIEEFRRKERKPAKVYKVYDKTFDTSGEMKEYKKQLGIRVRLLDADGKTSDEIAELTGLNKKSIARFILKR